MRKLLACFFLLFLVTVANSQHSVPTIGDYKKFLNMEIKKLNNVSDNFKIKDIKTNKEINLTEIERKVFVLFRFIKIKEEIKNLGDAWRDELYKLRNDPDKGLENDDDGAPAKETHVKKFINELDALQKKASQLSESAAEILFKNFPNEFTPKEKEFLLKNLREKK